MRRLTEAQADLLIRMGFVSNALRNDDETRPRWWLEGRPGDVKANVARSLIRLGLIRITEHRGGAPGLLGFTVTPAGRRALSDAQARETGERDDEGRTG